MSAPPPEPASADDAPAPPRRLDPGTLVLVLLRGLGPSSLLGLLLAFGWALGRGVPLDVLLGVFALLVTVSALVAWLQWRAFTYQVLPGEVVLKRGVLHRTRRTIPIERIQDVSIKQGPLARLFDLAEVRIETGGGAGDEGKLDSVAIGEAHRLRDVLQTLRARSVEAGAGDASGSPASGSASAEPETVVFRIRLPRLILSGLFSFSFIWLAAVFGAYEYANRLFDFDWRTLLGLLRLGDRDFRTWEDLRVALAALGVVLASGVAAGLVRTVLRDWGFVLARAEARFRVRRGLLTRTDVAVARRQIQLGLVRHGTFSGAFGWREFQVQTMGGGEETSGRQTLLPFNRVGEIAPVVALSGLPPFEPAALRPVARRHAVPGLVWFVLVPTAAAGAASVVFPPAAFLLALVAPALLVVFLRRGRHRYALAETSVQVRRGVFGRRDWTVPYGNVQVVAVCRGPFQRLLGLATVRVDTAGAGALGGGPHVHDLDSTVAAAVTRALLDRVDPGATPPAGSSGLGAAPQLR